MAATDDIAARRRRGEAALHEAVARAQEARAAAARRIGAHADADEAELRARQARERALSVVRSTDGAPSDASS